METSATTGSWFDHGTSRIYYEDHGTGDPILLLPGFAGSIEEFNALRDTLVTEKYRVITADLPGSGRSEPQPRAYTGSYYEDDARSFAALLEHLGVPPTHVMGFSDGGEVSLLMAALTPDVVRSVVTWGAVGVFSDPSGQLRGMMENIIDEPIPPLQSFRDYLVGAYGETNARTMTRNLKGAFDEIVNRGGDISLSKADNIDCGVLLVGGENDFMATPPLLAQLAGKINRAELLNVDGVGHDVYAERPEWLTQTIVGWLKKS
jgi:valacyclovir hydrolase